MLNISQQLNNRVLVDCISVTQSGLAVLFHKGYFELLIYGVQYREKSRLLRVQQCAK